VVSQNSLTATVEILIDLATDIVEGRRLPWDEETYLDSDSDSVESENESAVDLQGDTELRQLFARVKSVITSLMRLSMAMREPAPDAQVRTIDKSHFEQHDILHVQAKFPAASLHLTP
jgi:hypothetical protein